MVGPRAFHSWVSLGISSFNPRLIYFFRVFLHTFDVTSKLLGESILYFGRNPRRCFDESHSRARLEAKKGEVVLVIRNLARKPTEILRVLCNRRANAYDISHTIFELTPTDESRQFETSECVPVSPWVTDTLMKACERNEADSAARIYRKLSGALKAGITRGLVLEKLAQKTLDDIKSDTNLKIRGLTNPHQTNWMYHGPISRSNFDQSEFIAKINDAIKNNTPVHLVPLSPNFKAVDSIVYHPKDPILTLIQVTMNSEHPISVSGLQQIQKWLKLCSPSAKLRPNKSRRWRFVFIVPQYMVSTYRLQRFNNDTPGNAWGEKVDQCVMGIENGTVLDKADSS